MSLCASSAAAGNVLHFRASPRDWNPRLDLDPSRATENCGLRDDGVEWGLGSSVPKSTAADAAPDFMTCACEVPRHQKGNGLIRDICSGAVWLKSWNVQRIEVPLHHGQKWSLFSVAIQKPCHPKCVIILFASLLIT